MSKAVKLAKPLAARYPTFLVMRHGITSANSLSGNPELIRGWSEWPLSPDGRKRVEEAADRLKRLGTQITYILASDSGRAKETAEIVAKKLAADGGKRLGISTTHALRSWGLGVLEGQHEEKNKMNLAYYQRHPKSRVKDGESFDEFLFRFREFIRALVSYLRKHTNEIPLIVTHSKNFLALKYALTGTGKEKIPLSGAPKNERVMSVEVLPEGKFRIRNF